MLQEMMMFIAQEVSLLNPCELGGVVLDPCKLGGAVLDQRKPHPLCQSHVIQILVRYPCKLGGAAPEPCKPGGVLL